MSKTNLVKWVAHRVLPQVSAQSFIGTKQRAYGIDLSGWEPEFNPELATPGLLDFNINKASEGLTYVDKTFDSHYLASLNLQVNGAYHYLRSGMSAKSQMDLFLSRCAGKHLDILAVDFEKYNNVMNDAFVKLFFDAMVYLTQVRPANSKPIIYTNPDIYDTIIYPAAIRLWGKDVFLAWDLWIAQYPYIVNLDGVPYMPKKRADWKIWQFSDAGNPVEHGTTAWVDRNIFNGSIDDMLTWLGKDIPSTGDNMVEDKYFKVNAGISSLNIRSSAENLGATNDLGTFNLTAGDIIHSVEMSGTTSATYHRMDKIWRGGVALPFSVNSPTGQYWAAERDQYGTYMAVTDFTPPTTQVKPVLHVTIQAEGYPVTLIDINPL